MPDFASGLHISRRSVRLLVVFVIAAGILRNLCYPRRRTLSLNMALLAAGLARDKLPRPTLGGAAAPLRQAVNAAYSDVAVVITGGVRAVSLRYDPPTKELRLRAPIGAFELLSHALYPRDPLAIVVREVHGNECVTESLVNRTR